MKYIIIVIALISFQVFSQSVIIEPLIGFEKYYRASPEPAKFRTRTLLGARATYGVPLVSAELEVSTGEDSDSTLNGTITKTVNKREQAKLGVASNIALASMLHFFMRLGARAAKDTVTLTDNGTSTTTEGDVEIDPYFGTGLRVVLGTNFSLNAGITATQVSVNGETKYDMQTSFSASIGFGKF